MTSHAEPRTPLDDVIDDVAHAMSPHTAPDLRTRIAERIDQRQVSFGWWQPALAAAMLVAVVAGWWLMPNRTHVEHAQPIVATRSTPQAPADVETPAPATPGPSQASIIRPRRGAGRAPQSGAQSNMPEWPPDSQALPRIAVDSLLVEAVDAFAPIETPVADIPALVVESLWVEPLPRSPE